MMQIVCTNCALCFQSDAKPGSRVSCPLCGTTLAASDETPAAPKPAAPVADPFAAKPPAPVVEAPKPAAPAPTSATPQARPTRPLVVVEGEPEPAVAAPPAAARRRTEYYTPHPTVDVREPAPVAARPASAEPRFVAVAEPAPEPAPKPAPKPAPEPAPEPAPKPEAKPKPALGRATGVHPAERQEGHAETGEMERSFFQQSAVTEESDDFSDLLGEEKSGGGKTLIIALAAVIVVLAAGGAYFLFGMTSSPTAAPMAGGERHDSAAMPAPNSQAAPAATEEPAAEAPAEDAPAAAPQPGLTAEQRREIGTAHFTQASQHIVAGDFAKAVEEYLKVLEFMPDSAGTYIGLGSAYQQMERKSEARAAYSKALELQPNHPQAAQIRQLLGTL